MPSVPSPLRGLRLVAPALAVACAAPLAAPARADVIDVDPAGLAELLDEGVPIVDIRRPDEWADTGVVEGSRLMTFFDADGGHDAAAWKAALDELVDADEPVILICRSDRRTGIVSEWLSGRAGHATVYDVDGGITAWLRSGGETVAPDGR